ncbi:MAG: alanine racemase [Actinobacteria bacterium]|nr:alanine racemase [Actinomycetota bacterium]
MTGPFRPTVAEVDLEAIRHNVRALKPDGVELMAVVKADGYGHGAVPVARAALQAGATWLGVALVEEGLALRDSGVDAPVLVLSEFPPGSEKDALEAGLTPSLYTERGLAALAGAAGRDVGVHVKVDTGMHRVGLWPPEEALAFADRVVDAGLRLEGLWTHFARSDEDAAVTTGQLERFLTVADALGRAGHRPRYRHAANSAATIRLPAAHLDLVRVGIALYGLGAAPGLAEEAGLRPALSWRSEVSMARRLPAGESVSYGHRYRLERDAWVATVPVGYADGYSRRLSGRAEVLLGGRRRPVAGTVTMDQILVDCGDDRVEEGQEVVLIGRQGEEEIRADDLAAWSGTIPYEIVTGIGGRVPREHRG